MPWSQPAARMRECALAIRAIWRAWETEEPLRFEGEFYIHTLMRPRFDPGPNPHGNPPIFVAAVGERMTDDEMQATLAVVGGPDTAYQIGEPQPDAANQHCSIAAGVAA